MKRIGLFIVGILALAAAGFAVYSLGSRLGSRTAAEIVGTVLQNPVDMTDVVLKTGGNKDVSLADYKDSVTLVFFGFTRCPDVCPITLSRLAKLYEDLGKPKDLKVLMITVDPEFDTPDIAHAYASGFHPDFVGLSGSNNAVAQVMEKFYVGAAGMGTEQFFHTDVVFVLNRKAQMKYLYGQDNMAQLPTNVETLLATKDW